MKRQAWRSSVSIILAVLIVFGIGRSAQGAETLRSPDGKVTVSFELKEGRPFWDVTYGNNQVIQNGLLGVETGPDNFCGIS